MPNSEHLWKLTDFYRYASLDWYINLTYLVTEFVDAGLADWRLLFIVLNTATEHPSAWQTMYAAFSTRSVLHFLCDVEVPVALVSCRSQQHNTFMWRRLFCNNRMMLHFWSANVLSSQAFKCGTSSERRFNSWVEFDSLLVWPHIARPCLHNNCTDEMIVVIAILASSICFILP